MNIELTDREVTCLEKAVESVIKGMYEELRLTEDEEYRMLLGEPLSELERIAEKLSTPTKPPSFLFSEDML